MKRGRDALLFLERSASGSTSEILKARIAAARKQMSLFVAGLSSFTLIAGRPNFTATNCLLFLLCRAHRFAE